ncbi:hypothetical protein VNO77_35046 [Canavalia gladiata]|uniref:Uncharacterized protein n=1 Tax=Canavalia gladiata TaxID=3824 RepID=A0AAN9KHD5_CANGL
MEPSFAMFILRIKHSLGSYIDLFFLFHMVLKFLTAFISPTSRIYGHKNSSPILAKSFSVPQSASKVVAGIVNWRTGTNSQ